MRVAVFAHDTHPDIHSPLCRKKLSYAVDLVARGLAQWVDPDDYSRGCIGLRHLNLREVGDVHEASLGRAAGWGFDAAWGIRQSGWAGPLTWQLRTAKD